LGESVNNAICGDVLVYVPSHKEYGPGKAGPQRDFVRRLCVTLFHRWRPGRIFVILTSYYDEAGTHGGSPVTVMAGVMATAKSMAQVRDHCGATKAELWLYGLSLQGV
jgi:hypothetical protein